MSICIQCDRCGRSHEVADDRAGQTGRCSCGNLLPIPEKPAICVECQNCGATSEPGATRCAQCNGPLSSDEAFAKAPDCSAADTAAAEDAPSTVSINCGQCKQDFDVQAQSLVSTTSADDTKPNCPKCNKPCTSVQPKEIGCPFCRRAFWMDGHLFDSRVECPHCRKELRIPAADNMARAAEEFKWEIIPAAGGEPRVLTGVNRIAQAICAGQLHPNDTCREHEFAPPRPLREACDEHFALHILYDPKAAYIKRAGEIGGIALLIMYLVAHVVGGIISMGGTYILAAVFGIAAVLLTPTVIGLFIVYIIAKACGIPLLGAYLGVLIIAIIGVIFYFIGVGIGRGVMALLVRPLKLERKRAVNWG